MRRFNTIVLTDKHERVGMPPMNSYATFFIAALLVTVTAVQCSALRTQANTLRVARVRRLEEVTE